MLNKAGVYKITCVPTGKIYVGSAVSFRNRWSCHRSNLKSHTHHSSELQKLWDIYGEAGFSFDVLIVCAREHRVMYEQKALDRLQPELNTCKKAGVTRGTRRTPEQRKVQSEAQKRWMESHPEEVVARTARMIETARTVQSRENISAKARQRLSHPEARQKLTEALRGSAAYAARFTTECRLAMSVARCRRVKKYRVLSEMLTSVEVEARYGITQKMFRARMHAGWSASDAATTPAKQVEKRDWAGLCKPVKVCIGDLTFDSMGAAAKAMNKRSVTTIANWVSSGAVPAGNGHWSGSKVEEFV
jgi:group I intron endonuclease